LRLLGEAAAVRPGIDPMGRGAERSRSHQEEDGHMNQKKKRKES